MSCRVKLFLDLLGTGQMVLFRLPTRGQPGRFFFQRGEFLLQLAQPVGGSAVGFLFQRLALDLELDDAAVKLVDLFGFGIDFHAQPGCGFIDQVDRLVG